MTERRSRQAAREIIGTIPVITQSIMFELRRGDGFMPMPHFRALVVLGQQGPCMLTELAGFLRVSPPTMSNTVRVLVQRGWAERLSDERDRRRVTLRLTEPGGEALRRAYAEVEDLIAARLSDLSDDELERLRSGVAVMRKAFAADGDGEG